MPFAASRFLRRAVDWLLWAGTTEQTPTAQIATDRYLADLEPMAILRI